MSCHPNQKKTGCHHFFYIYYLNFYCKQEFSPASLIAQLVKNPPAVQETLGWEDLLEKG